MTVSQDVGVGVAKLKASLSAYLARVKAGQTVLVTEHGRPIARLVPIDESTTDVDARLVYLERKGLVSRGAGGVLDALHRLQLPTDATGRSLEVILEERESGL